MKIIVTSQTDTITVVEYGESMEERTNEEEDEKKDAKTENEKKKNKNSFYAYVTVEGVQYYTNLLSFDDF